MADLDMGGKYGPLIAAATAAAGAASELITKTEASFLNVPLSMLYMAIAGTMIGVFLLPGKEAARISTDHGDTARRRTVYMLLTAGFLGAVVLCYSFISAWTVQVGIGVVHTVTRLVVSDSLAMPITALVGVGIRPWLPALLKAVERRATTIIGGGQ